MAKYKMWVRVPAGQNSKLTRPIEKTVEANSGVEAAAILQGQFGKRNVVGSGASKVMSGLKTRPRLSKSSKPINKSINYKRSKKKFKNITKNTSEENSGSGVGIGIYLIVILLFWIFNVISHQILFSIFGKGKVSYWYVHNKHAVAFSLASMNIMMFLLLIGYVFNYLIL